MWNTHKCVLRYAFSKYVRYPCNNAHVLYEISLITCAEWMSHRKNGFPGRQLFCNGLPRHHERVRSRLAPTMNSARNFSDFHVCTLATPSQLDQISVFLRKARVRTRKLAHVSDLCMPERISRGSFVVQYQSPLDEPFEEPLRSSFFPLSTTHLAMKALFWSSRRDLHYIHYIPLTFQNCSEYYVGAFSKRLTSFSLSEVSANFPISVQQKIYVRQCQTYRNSRDLKYTL